MDSDESADHEFGEVLAQRTLWTQMQDVLRPAEVHAVARIIGQNMIDDNELLASELRNLVSILVDYRDSNTKRHDHQASVMRSLPAPPSRELLQSKLQSLLKKATQEGEGYLPSTPRERAVVEYIINPEVPGRPASALSSRSAITPTINGTDDSSVSRPTSACSVRSTESNFDIGGVRGKLNVIDIDDVLRELHVAFSEENECLMHNVEYVRQCLEDEMTFNARSASFSVPTMAELSTLETTLQGIENKKAHEDKIKNLPLARKKGPGSVSSVSTIELLQDQLPALRTFPSDSRGSSASSRSSRGTTPRGGTPPSAALEGLDLHPVPPPPRSGPTGGSLECRKPPPPRQPLRTPPTGAAAGPPMKVLPMPLKTRPLRTRGPATATGPS